MSGFKGVSVVAGVVMLLGSTTGIAQGQTVPQDVIVDTDSPVSSPSNGSFTNTRFSCQFVNGEYVVMYHPETQAGQAYPWARPTTMGGGWTPERRCTAISQRLESYRPDGLLEMQTARSGNYNVVCVTTQRIPGCRIVLTVPPGQDPLLTRDRVFESLTVADSGQNTQGVNTFTSGDNLTQLLNDLFNLRRPAGSVNTTPRRTSPNIDLRPFLDRADGGTGNFLRGGMSTGGQPNRNPRLNPDRFR